MSNTQREQSASASRPGERLRDYDRLKLELGQTLQTVLHLVGGQEHQEQHRRWRELLTRLAEDRFVLAVVGQFNRGKSSLMNAILGLDRLPVGIVPLTSVITKVAYGNPERVLIEFEGRRLRTTIRRDQLGDYVTEEGNPGNQKRIAAAEVQLPSEFLRRGLFFVDTPGVGSAIAANTATTERFLPEADAVIFVTSFDSPLSRDELAFLQRVRDHVRKIFFVVNKADLAPQEQRGKVMNFVREQIEQETGLHEPRLLAVSALAGLEAKLVGVPERLASSGLPALEAELIEFLTTEKNREFLLRLCERALSLLADLDPVAPTEGHKATFDEVAARIVNIRDRVIETAGAGEGFSATPAKGVMPTFEPEVAEAVRKACRVCTRVADAMFKFMAKFQYQILINAQERSTLASRGGLCPLHTWQYSEIASPQGIAASFPAVLMTLSKRLSGLAESEGRNTLGAETKRLLTKPEQCRACQEQLSAEERVIEEIVREITSMGGGLSKTPVLCLPHLSALLRKLPDAEVASQLVAFEAAVLERLAENMERYALKHDALRRSLQSEDERVAYHQALSQLVGDKRLQAPWRVQYLL